MRDAVPENDCVPKMHVLTLDQLSRSPPLKGGELNKHLRAGTDHILSEHGACVPCKVPSQILSIFPENCLSHTAKIAA